MGVSVNKEGQRMPNHLREEHALDFTTIVRKQQEELRIIKVERDALLKERDSLLEECKRLLAQTNSASDERLWIPSDVPLNSFGGNL